MTALHHTREAAPMPCRSRVSGRYMPASRQLADRLDKADSSIDAAFAELHPIGAALDRLAAGTASPADADLLRDAHDVLWSALEKIGTDLGEVRELLGVAHG